MLFFPIACLKQTAYAEVLNNNNNDTLISISSLRKLHIFGAVESITHSSYIEGVVVANDEHDNIYKSLCVQDSTGGIVLLMDGVSLYQKYPIGSQIQVRIKNLFLTDYRRMVQLATSVDTSNGNLVSVGIPAPLYPKYISILKENSPIIPLLVYPKNLSDSLQGRLIKIVGVTAPHIPETELPWGVLTVCMGGQCVLQLWGGT